MTGRIEVLTAPAARALAEPLSLLHHAAFPDDPWDRMAITQIAGLAGFFGLLAREHGDPAGFALVFGAGDTCEIAALGVVPACRRTGLGAALLAAVSAEARRRAARVIILEVAADNAAAQALYAANGFVPAGRRQNYYRRAGRSVDAHLLRLALS